MGANPNHGHESGYQRALRIHRISCLSLKYTVMSSALISAKVITENEHKAIKDIALCNETRMDELIGLLHQRMNQHAFEAFVAGAHASNIPTLAIELESESAGLGNDGPGSRSGSAGPRRHRHRPYSLGGSLWGGINGSGLGPNYNMHAPHIVMAHQAAAAAAGLVLNPPGGNAGRISPLRNHPPPLPPTPPLAGRRYGNENPSPPTNN